MGTKGSGTRERRRKSTPNAQRVWPLDILIVDDDPNARHVLAAVLEASGHTCREAPDGKAAAAMLREKRADVVLCDWEMPGMSGADLCRGTRRAEDENQYTYFILMTAHHHRGYLLAGMEAGADDFQRKPLDMEELEARLVLASRVLSLHRRLRDQAAALRRDSQRLYVASHTDALTGVSNRLALQEELGALRSEHQRYGHRSSLAICDVDHFKQYNDRYGHLVGDDALRQVAHTLRNHLRASDRVYRYGGEEFVVLLPEQKLDEAESVVQRLRLEVRALAIPAPTPSGVLTLSAGVAELEDADDSGEAWLSRADKALYRAKTLGRDRVETAKARSRDDGEMAASRA